MIQQTPARLPGDKQIEVAVLIGFTAGHGTKHTQAVGAAPLGEAEDLLPPFRPQCVQGDHVSIVPHQLAMALRVPATRINDIVNEKRGITADTALRLSRYFGTTSRFWMNMQASWELEVADDELGDRVRRDVLPRTA